MPCKGTTVQPIQSSIAEEAFQTILVSRVEAGLPPSKRPENRSTPPGHLALANGDATFMATH